jgi:HSP20 family molecular chaperone IbpA
VKHRPKEAFMTAMKTVGRASTFPAQADIVESVDHYLVELDVSDFALDELRVQLDADRVTVIGDQVLGSDEIEPAFRLRERLEETFRLPEDSEPDGVTALFEHGTLELCIPKRPEVRLEQRIIPIRRRQHGVINPDATPS